MKTLEVTNKRNTFKVYLKDKFYTEIVFKNVTNEELKLDENKDIALNVNSKLLFTFKFDKLWNGAEVINSQNNT